MPQKAWSSKDERQYEHIKQSAKDRGRSEDRAKEIAARTVNKQRHDEGRDKQKSSSATGNPNTPLEDRVVSELRNRAEKLGIPNYSKMNKDQLIREIRQRQ